MCIVGLGKLALLEVWENSLLCAVEDCKSTGCSNTKIKLLTKCLKNVLKIPEIKSAVEFLFTELGAKKFPTGLLER